MAVFNTHILDAILRQQREAQEQERQMLLALLCETLDSLSASYRLDQVYIFGSLIRPWAFGHSPQVRILILPSNRWPLSISLPSWVSWPLNLDGKWI